MSPSEPPPLEQAPLSEEDRATWGARFGWLAGAVVGLFAGFALTFALESWVLRPRFGARASELGGRLSSVLVAGFFLLGALAGHGFGLRAGPARYRALGLSAGLSVVTLVVAWLVLAR